jgi:hypothetical protein
MGNSARGTERIPRHSLRRRAAPSVAQHRRRHAEVAEEKDVELVDDGAHPTRAGVPYDDLRLVVAALELELPHDRVPEPVEPLPGGGLQLHRDALVVAEELAALPVGHDEEELHVGELAPVFLLEVQRTNVDLRGDEHGGLAESLLVPDVVGHAQRDAVSAHGESRALWITGSTPFLGAIAVRPVSVRA